LLARREEHRAIDFAILALHRYDAGVREEKEMLKGRDLIGMPVVVRNTGVEIERVEGLVLDLAETHVSALLVDSDDWSRQARILSLEDVQSFGEKEIEVGSASVIHAVDQIPDIARMLHSEPTISGAHLVTNDGTDVGTVNDLLFDEATGGIDSFEVLSNGLSDLYFKHEPLPLFDELDHEIIVHTSNVHQLPDAQRLIRRKHGDQPIQPEHAKIVQTVDQERRAGILTFVSNVMELLRDRWRRLLNILSWELNGRWTRPGQSLAQVFPAREKRHFERANAAITGKEEQDHVRGWLDDWWPPYI